MTISAFQRVVGFHPPPFMLGKLQAHIEKFLPGVDGAENLAPDFLGCLHLACNLDRPFMRNVAIRTGRAHAGPIGEVHRPLQLLISVVMHLVAADAEPFRVRQLQGGIEGAPEKDAADKAAKREKAKGKVGAGPADKPPEPDRKSLHTRHHASHGRILTASALRAPCPQSYSRPAAL